MRGCYLATDVDGRTSLCAGTKDGKVTHVHIDKDGRLGSVMDGVSTRTEVRQSATRPHVNSVRPDTG